MRVFERTINSGIVLLIILCANRLNAQVYRFNIIGKVSKVNNGKVFLIKINVDKKYYCDNITVDSAEIVGGKFKMQRNAYDNYTYAYRFLIHSSTINGTTGLVFIEPKNQIVIIDSINGYVYPLIQNSSLQNEMKYSYGQFFKGFAQKAVDLDRYLNEMYKKYGSEIPKEELIKLNEIRNQMVTTGDSMLEYYVNNHRDSYVSLWKLLDRFNNFGYKNNILIFTIY